ncbi:hypothetical protein FHL15_008010 [Xylaria flabelliformis]|uniref:Uncharacterized protein n=1 Tax=Xylaria flabelliformis TaxID=2512241 RepID=A0A553HSU7_9PEZI|nr:hypothetical protein FHL15_008010 [Xylaria flabelliformis]
MSQNLEAKATATAGVEPSKVVKDFHIDWSQAARVLFASALTNDGTLCLPSTDDSLKGLRFVSDDGQEHAYKPYFRLSLLSATLGALTEIKKYLYDIDVT